MQELTFHRFCNLLPDMSGDDFTALKDDIMQNGLINPITTFNGQILDGKHRYKACKELNTPPAFKTFAGDEEQALHFVISQNISRRHLSAGQKAALAVEAKSEFSKIAKDKQKEDGKEWGGLGGRGNKKESEHYKETLRAKMHEGLLDKPSDERSDVKAAKLYNVGARYICAAEKVKNKSPEVFEKVRNGKFNLQEAKHLITLSEPVRAAAIGLIETGGVTKVKEAIYRAKKEDFNEKVNNAETILNGDDKPVKSDINVENSDIFQVGNHILICGDNTNPVVIEYLKKYRFPFCFADPPYNALDKDYDGGGFVWSQDYLTEIADIVCITPGTISIKEFMKSTNMSYKWALATVFSNLHAPAAVGYRQWDFTAIFSGLKSIHKNIKDAINLSIPNMPESEKEIAKNRQKPAVYLTWLIESFTKMGDLILDPFVGSGNIILVAETLKRKCIAVEILPDMCSEIIKRFKQKFPDDREVKNIGRLGR